jgi:hypothetical protein
MPRSTLRNTRNKNGIIEFQKWIPKRYQAILGTAWYIRSTGKRTDREAAPIHARIRVEYDAAIAAAEAQLAPPPGFDVLVSHWISAQPYWERDKLVRLPPDAPGLVRTEWGAVLLEPNQLAPGQEVIDINGNVVARGLPFNEHAPPVPLANASPVVRHARAIDLWEARRRRDGKPNSAAIRGKLESKIDRLIRHLGHDDMARVKAKDLEAYFDKFTEAPGTIRDHIICIQSLYRLAHKRELILLNPSAGLTYSRDTGDSYQPFTPEERARQIRMARQSTDPNIKWPVLVASFSGARLAEIVEANTADIVIEDGVPVFHVRKKHRTGDEKVLTTLDLYRLG